MHVTTSQLWRLALPAVSLKGKLRNTLSCKLRTRYRLASSSVSPDFVGLDFEGDHQNTFSSQLNFPINKHQTLRYESSI